MSFIGGCQATITLSASFGYNNDMYGLDSAKYHIQTTN